MDKPEVNSSAESANPQQNLSLDTFVTTVFESAVSAFIKSILVTVFGSIALGLAGGIWEEMAPSAPPGFAGKPEAEAVHSSAWRSVRGVLDQHAFAIVFSVLFACTLWVRLARPKETRDRTKSTSRLQKMGKHLAEEWFSLIVVNAIGAMISAIVLVWVQQFTVDKIFLGWLVDSVLAGVINVVQALLWNGPANGLHAWFDWYGDNLLKFNFWIFYLAAICDDLGLPTFKTLGRWLGRRVRQRRVMRKTQIST